MVNTAELCVKVDILSDIQGHSNILGIHVPAHVTVLFHIRWHLI